jgi:hypothetical protein
VCLEIKKKEEKAIKMSKEEKSSLWLKKCGFSKKLPPQGQVHWVPQRDCVFLRVPFCDISATCGSLNRFTHYLLFARAIKIYTYRGEPGNCKSARAAWCLLFCESLFNGTVCVRDNLMISRESNLVHNAFRILFDTAQVMKMRAALQMGVRCREHWLRVFLMIIIIRNKKRWIVLGTTQRTWHQSEFSCFVKRKPLAKHGINNSKKLALGKYQTNLEQFGKQFNQSLKNSRIQRDNQLYGVARNS